MPPEAGPLSPEVEEVRQRIAAVLAKIEMSWMKSILGIKDEESQLSEA